MKVASIVSGCVAVISLLVLNELFLDGTSESKHLTSAKLLSVERASSLDGVRKIVNFRLALQRIHSDKI